MDQLWCNFEVSAKVKASSCVKKISANTPHSRSWWLGCGSHATEMNMRVSSMRKVDDTLECPVWWVVFESIIPFFWFCVSGLIHFRVTGLYETQGCRSLYEEDIRGLCWGQNQGQNRPSLLDSLINSSAHYSNISRSSNGPCTDESSYIARAPTIRTIYHSGLLA